MHVSLFGRIIIILLKLLATGKLVISCSVVLIRSRFMSAPARVLEVCLELQLDFVTGEFIHVPFPLLYTAR